MTSLVNSRLVFFLAGAALWCAASASAQVTLAQHGKSSYTIYISPDASASERRAAGELQYFIEKMSGARLEVLAVGENVKVRRDAIFVGRSAALDKIAAGIPFDTLGDEGFALKTQGRALIVAGGRRRGTMYGIYTLLDKLGCRWFTPDVSRIPKLDPLRIPALDETRRPAFEYREPFFTEANDKDWAARNRVNGQTQHLDESAGGRIQYFPFVHSFDAMIPPSKYFKDHPEYFSLIDGKRRAERTQLCLTNPEVVRLGVEAVRRWIKEHPEATIFSVSQNDWTGWCECDNCRRAEEEEGGVHSGPLVRYVNQVAAEIEKTNPDKLIDTLAYWYTERAPSKTRPRSNVRIRICPIGACEAHPYEQCPYNRLFVNILKDWGRMTNNIYVWHYNTNFAHYLLPFPDFDELAADMELYRSNGVVGVFLEGDEAGGGGGENAELRSYVMARLLWDPKTDVDRDVNDFLEGCYGPAAKPMRAYFDLQHQQVRPAPRGKGHHIWIFQPPRVSYLNRDFLDRGAALLREAATAATNETARRRVARAQLSLEYVELARARQYQVTGESYQPPALDKLRTRFAEFIAAAKSFGIDQLHEGKPIAEDEKGFADRIRPYRVVTLENAAVRVRVVPELSARIVEITDKRTGANLLRVPDGGAINYPDLSGVVVGLFPDHHGREIPVAWRPDAQPRDSAVTIEGSTADGRMVLRRTIRLSDDGTVTTNTEVQNTGGQAVTAALQARADYSPGDDIDGTGLSIAYRSVDGTVRNQALFQPGQETSINTPIIEGGARPDGRWTAYQRGISGLTNTFPAGQVERMSMNWSIRGGPLVTLGLWSKELKLEPGAKVSLEASYRASGGAPE
jgi:hypothetical protein